MEARMKTFAVDRSLGDISLEDLGGAQAAAIREASAATERGVAVTYVRSVFRPESGSCTCLFEAGDKADVEEVNKAAGLPYDRIVEALDIPHPERA
jgi:hypothetical protein